MRQIAGGLAVKKGAASESAMGRLETEMLTQPDNLAGLADLPGRWIDPVHDRRSPKFITLDMDSSESPVHGDPKSTKAENVWRTASGSRKLFGKRQMGNVGYCL